MKSIVLNRSFLLTLALVCVFPAVASAQQVVNFGTLAQFTGPDDLDLDGDIVYAVDLNGDMDRTVNGVQFLTDNNPIPGYLNGFNQIVSAWQVKPEYGDTTDDNNLEEIMHDIRWTEIGVAGGDIGVTFDVVNGLSYKMQLLWSGNHDEDRRWSVEVNGALALEEVQSLAEEGYDIGRSTVYTHEFLALSNQATVRYIQGTTGLDPNGILQAVILERLETGLVPGDVNGDQVVDLADYAVIRDNLYTGSGIAEGDVDFDGDVDISDFAFWKNEFENMGGGGAVPEPASLTLLFAGLLTALAVRRRFH